MLSFVCDRTVRILSLVCETTTSFAISFTFVKYSYIFPSMIVAVILHSNILIRSLCPADCKYTNRNVDYLISIGSRHLWNVRLKFIDSEFRGLDSVSGWSFELFFWIWFLDWDIRCRCKLLIFSFSNKEKLEFPGSFLVLLQYYASDIFI